MSHKKEGAVYTQITFLKILLMQNILRKAKKVVNKKMMYKRMIPRQGAYHRKMYNVKLFIINNLYLSQIYICFMTTAFMQMNGFEDIRCVILIAKELQPMTKLKQP